MAFFETSVMLLDRETGNYRQVSSTELVPGDIVEVPKGMLPCDMILLSGSAIVNEAILTGESVPVIKNQLLDSVGGYKEKDCEKQTLYGGTEVI